MKTCIPEDQAVVQGWIECWMKTKIESKETQITEGIKKIKRTEEKTNYKQGIEGAKLEGQGTWKLKMFVLP